MGKNVKFETKEVAALYAELKDWCHPEYPFLDPEYSPGSLCPVTDFTAELARWLADGNVGAIAELWWFLSNHGTADTTLLRYALGTRVSSQWGLDAASSMEMLAINLLMARMALQYTPSDARSHVATSLAATRLASIAWQPPDGVRDILRDNAVRQAVVIPGVGQKRRRIEQAEAGMAELLGEVGEDVRAVGQWMVLIPPMARVVVVDYFTRSWGENVLRPELYYTERQYGCCSGLNLHYIQWMGCFSEPTDNDSATKITKIHLASGLREAGVAFKKSAKWEDLLNSARTVPGLVASLIKTHAPEKVYPKKEWEAGLWGWVERTERLRCIAAVIIASLAQQSLKRFPH